MFESLAQFFREGGPAMMVNLATAAVAVAIIVERIIVLAFSLNLNAGPFMEQIQKLGSVVAAVCDRELLMAEQLASRYGITRFYSDFDEMLAREKPDVVHITTPPASDCIAAWVPSM